MPRFLSSRYLSLAGLLVSLHAGGALAQDRQPSSETVLAGTPDDDVYTRSEQVAVASGELATSAGRDAVMRRIGRAVRRVCSFDETATLAERSAYESCRRDSLADAVARLDVLVASNNAGPVQVATAERP